MNRKKRDILKPTRILFLIVLLAANTFAWFIYATKVDNHISVHVKAWNVVFEAGENQVTNNINLTVDDLYPGMEDYSYEIKAYNRGEVSATLSYKILSARILNDEYITVDGRAELNQQAQAGDLTSQQLENKLLNDYPFSIAMAISNTYMQLGNGEESFTFDVTWPYESQNDELDTTWGINAAEYKEDHPQSSSISIQVKLIITQNAS